MCQRMNARHPKTCRAEEEGEREKWEGIGGGGGQGPGGGIPLQMGQSDDEPDCREAAEVMSPSQEEGEQGEDEDVALGVGSDKRRLSAVFVAGDHTRGGEGRRR